MSNHRASIKNLQPQPLYKHFISDGHSLDDLIVQPIEKVELCTEDEVSLHSKRLQREDFWMRELRTIQPYGLNDNIRSVGSISKLPTEPVVWRYFHPRKRVRSINQGDVHKVPQSLNTINPRNGLLAKLVITNPSAFLRSL